MELESRRLIEDKVKFAAGRHLRCHIHEIDNTKFEIKDMGGYWEMSFGEPATEISLKAGGDVTLVIDEKYGEYLPDIVGGLEIVPTGQDKAPGGPEQDHGLEQV